MMSLMMPRRLYSFRKIFSLEKFLINFTRFMSGFYFLLLKCTNNVEFKNHLYFAFAFYVHVSLCYSYSICPKNIEIASR